jgi:predicted ATP-grasp superfamily ATP-dependent carboligase
MSRCSGKEDGLPPALVTSAQSRVGYTVARQLAKAGIPVIVGSGSENVMAMQSRHVCGSFVHPSPFKDEDGFVQCLLETADKYSAKVLMPMLEETFLVAKAAGRLRERFAIAMPSYETLLNVHDKYRLGLLAEEIGVPTPRLASFEQIAADRSLLDAFRFPVLVKPRQGGGGWAVNEFETPASVFEILERRQYLDLPLERFFVQEKIKGSGIGLAMLYGKGTCMASIGYRQVRTYPVPFGQPTYRASVHHPESERHLRTLLDHLEWDGVCQADFLISREDGTPYLIDVNPRYWGSVGHSIAAGVNIPVMHYRLALGLPCEPVAGFDVDARSRWLGGDIMSFAGSYRLAENKFAFVKDFLFTRSAYCDDFSFDDPVPFFRWGWDKLRRKGHGDAMEGIWK